MRGDNAHLLAALGPAPDERMGTNLRDLYSKVEQGEKEPLRFLRDTLPQMSAPQRSIALERTEAIYRRLMQAHLDNGRKTYATGACYCALLGEIAVHEGRLAAFRQWYEGFIELEHAIVVHGYFEPGIPLEKQNPSVVCGTMGGDHIPAGPTVRSPLVRSELVGQGAVANLLHLVRLGKLDIDKIRTIVRDPGQVSLLIQKVGEISGDAQANKGLARNEAAQSDT